MSWFVIVKYKIYDIVRVIKNINPNKYTQKEVTATSKWGWSHCIALLLWNYNIIAWIVSFMHVLSMCFRWSRTATSLGTHVCSSLCNIYSRPVLSWSLWCHRQVLYKIYLLFFDLRTLHIVKVKGYTGNQNSNPRKISSKATTPSKPYITTCIYQLDQQLKTPKYLYKKWCNYSVV